MKIVELNTFCGVGSTGRIALELARLAASEGDECIIGFGAGDAPPEADAFAPRTGTPLERKLHGAMRKLLDAEGYGSLRGTRALIWFLRAYQPDVIHLHNLHGCYLHLRTLFAHLASADIPVVWTLHDCWPFTGHCAYFDYAGCDRWQTLCHDCPQQRTYPVCVGLDGSKRNYLLKKELFASVPRMTLVTPCQWLCDLLPSSSLSCYPRRVSYNGVDTRAFRPMPSDVRARYGLDGVRLVLAVASEWVERKGLRYLTALADSLGAGYRVAVLGLTPDQIAALPAALLALPRTSSVAELAAWYSAADCLVNPTLEDNMPMVNLESLACGTPVAVFRTGGSPECVDDTCGRVVDKGDSAALREAVIDLCARKPALSAACVRRAEAFESGRCYRDYLALYREVAQ